jgi:hypothetical protein
MSSCEWLHTNSYAALYGANVILEEFNKKIPNDTDEETAMSVLNKLNDTKKIIQDIEDRLLHNFTVRYYDKLLPKSWRNADEMLKKATEDALKIGDFGKETDNGTN